MISSGTGDEYSLESEDFVSNILGYPGAQIIQKIQPIGFNE